jgi:membrane associated rhomboid family serine protease
MIKELWTKFKLKFFKSGSPVLLYIGLNVAIFLVVSLLSIFCFFIGQAGLIDLFVDRYFAFPAAKSEWLSHFYTLITYQFFHSGVLHILFNMLWLYWMGQLFLDFVKPRQFHFVYLCGGIIGALFFALIINLVPAYQAASNGYTLIGASAAVMAVFTALITLVPNYNINLMLVGQVKLKYVLLVYICLDVIGTTSINAGGSLAHLGGALFGFAYVRLLQSGTDLSIIFKRKQKLKVVRNESPKKSSTIVNQKEIDAILDKISTSGYDKLSREEKETLFKASKN